MYLSLLFSSRALPSFYPQFCEKEYLQVSDIYILFCIFSVLVFSLCIVQNSDVLKTLDMDAFFGQYWDVYIITALLGLNIMLGVLVLARRHYV